MANTEGGELFEFDANPIIKGYPELRWTGKRPYTATQYYPAQLRESYGEATNGWMNKIFWGDNLQVMSHMLKEYRGKIDLIYIDPPFDSKEDYKKKIKLRGKAIAGDSMAFEEKQYGDIWTSDEYLQFMYERLIVMRELLSDRGSIFLHCDWHRSHQLRMLLDEVFGPNNFINEIAWCYFGPGSPGMRQYNRKHDSIFWYSKTHGSWIFNADSVRAPHSEKTADNFKAGLKGSGFVADTYELADGKIPEDWWEFAIAGRYPNDGLKRVGYPTEKPYKLLERIIRGSSDPGSIVFDAFMGSGVTQMVAMQNGRRFIGADINLGSIQTTTKRLLGVARDLGQQVDHTDKYLGFEVYNVNNYDFFRNPIEAKELLIQALDIQPFASAGNNVFDGELDGYKVKILPTNRIATRADLKGLVSALPFATYDERKQEKPNSPVDHITLVCMGHEPDLKASLEQELDEYPIDVQVLDVLRDKKELELKREAEARVERDGDKLVIKSFYPLNLLNKLSLQKEHVDDWRELVESVMVDWNFDGAVMEPAVIDIPGKNELVAGVYDIPEDAGTIKVKITDVLSESLEVEV